MFPLKSLGGRCKHNERLMADRFTAGAVCIPPPRNVVTLLLTNTSAHKRLVASGPTDEFADFYFLDGLLSPLVGFSSLSAFVFVLCASASRNVAGGNIFCRVREFVRSCVRPSARTCRRGIVTGCVGRPTYTLPKSGQANLLSINQTLL